MLSLHVGPCEKCIFDEHHGISNRGDKHPTFSLQAKCGHYILVDVEQVERGHQIFSTRSATTLHQN